MILRHFFYSLTAALSITSGLSVWAMDNEDILLELHTALYDRDEDRALEILSNPQNNIDVNSALSADDKKDSWLHVAAENGLENVVKFLIAHGANINAKNLHDETPADLAELWQHQNVLPLLRPRTNASRAIDLVQQVRERARYWVPSWLGGNVSVGSN